METSRLSEVNFTPGQQQHPCYIIECAQERAEGRKASISTREVYPVMAGALGQSSQASCPQLWQSTLKDSSLITQVNHKASPGVRDPEELTEVLAVPLKHGFCQLHREGLQSPLT